MQARVALDGLTQEQEDYWKLVYAAELHNWDRQYWAILPEPVGDVAVVELHEPTRLGAPARFLLERFVGDAVAELIVGVTHDPSFGHALVLGSGGIAVELLDEVCTMLLPVDRSAVVRGLESLKVSKFIDGYRGRPAGDRSALIDAVMRIADMATDDGVNIVELDVNPLAVLPVGQGVMVLDALVTLAE